MPSTGASLPTLVKGHEVCLETPCKDDMPSCINHSNTFQEEHLAQTVKDGLPFPAPFIVDGLPSLIGHVNSYSDVTVHTKLRLSPP